MKRLTWFLSGIVTGAAGASYAKRKVRRTAATLDPRNVVKRGVGAVRQRGEDVVEALREGRQAMRAKEAELLARRDGHAVVEIHDNTIVLPADAEPGQVIVLRDVRDERGTTGPRRRRHAR